MSRLSQITEEQKARMRTVAIKLQTASLPIVKYQNCRFEMGSSAGVTDITGLDFIAAYDRLVACWKLFLNKQLKDTRPPVLVAEGGIPVRPESYPKEQWPEENGRPSDPWALQYEMPMISCDDGRHILFQASTIITRALIGRLLEACIDVGKRPFVVPEVNANPDKPEQMLPDFRITSWSDDDTDIPVNSPASPLNGSSAPATTGAASAATSIRAPADMDDDIPFGAEFR